MTTFFRRFLRDDHGGTAIEYGLIASLVFLVMLGAMQALSGNVIEMYDMIAAAVTDAVT